MINILKWGRFFKRSLNYFVYLLVFSLSFSCKGNKQNNPNEAYTKIDTVLSSINRIYFEFDSTKRFIIPLKFNDSVTSFFLFDTGSEGLVIDSLFLAENNMLPKKVKSEIKILFPFVKSGILVKAYKCDDSVSFDFGLQKITYPNFNIISKSLLFDNTNSGFSGYINIPVSDTIHIWELNFENNFIEVHSTESFNIPDNAVRLPFIIRKGKFYVDIPLILINKQDTLTSNHTYFMDSGAILTDLQRFPPSDEIDYLLKIQKPLFYMPYNILKKDITFHHFFKAKIFNQINIDSLKLSYSIDSKYYKGGGSVGLEFMKRFNIYFDLKNNIIGFVPHLKYKPTKITSNTRGVNVIKMIYMSENSNKYYIYDLKNFENNILTKAGVQIGDEIISVNQYSGKDIYYEKITINEIVQQSDEIIIQVIRNNQPITLKCRTE